MYPGHLGRGDRVDFVDLPSDGRPLLGYSHASVARMRAGRTKPDSNLYRYVRNNPINASDPSGLEGVGHHWIPQSVFDKLLSEGVISPTIRDYFDKTTRFFDVYVHRNDTWNNVSHLRYNEAVERIIRTIKKNRRLRNMKEAEYVVRLISTNKRRKGWLPKKVIKQLRTDMALVNQWREGFLQSITVAEAAMQLDSKLTKAESKAIARRIVNGDESVKLSRRARKVVEEYAGMSTTARRTLLRKAGKGAVTGTGIGLLFVLLDVKTGWAGEGQIHPELTGLSGAAHEVAYQAVMGPLVEELILSTVNSVGSLLPPAISRSRRAFKAGVSPDAIRDN